MGYFDGIVSGLQDTAFSAAKSTAETYFSKISGGSSLTGLAPSGESAKYAPTTAIQNGDPTHKATNATQLAAARSANWTKIGIGIALGVLAIAVVYKLKG